MFYRSLVPFLGTPRRPPAILPNLIPHSCHERLGYTALASYNAKVTGIEHKPAE
jgi:hypothetical protein